MGIMAAIDLRVTFTFFCKIRLSLEVTSIFEHGWVLKLHVKSAVNVH